MAPPLKTFGDKSPVFPTPSCYPATKRSALPAALEVSRALCQALLFLGKLVRLKAKMPSFTHTGR